MSIRVMSDHDRELLIKGLEARQAVVARAYNRESNNEIQSILNREHAEISALIIVMRNKELEF